MHPIETIPCPRCFFGSRLFVVVLLLSLPAALLRAQQQPESLPAVPATTRPAAPVAPAIARPDPEAPASLAGTVTDPSGAVVSGAGTTLESSGSSAAHIKLTASTGGDGTFAFGPLPAGTYVLTIVASGFSASARSFALHPGETLILPPIALALSSVNTTVQAATQEQIAEQQLRVQEKQRIFGVIPNFNVSYVWNAAPLTSKQKYRLALRTTTDPFSFAGAAFVAGLEQSFDLYSGYGQGATGYAKRFGANYGDIVVATMISQAILPSLFHQDPRYFYKGTGSKTSRTRYALLTPFRTRGDDRHWEPNYSSLLGSLAAGIISNAYYPASDRGVQITLQNTVLAIGVTAFAAEMQEFVVRKLIRHPTPIPTPAP